MLICNEGIMDYALLSDELLVKLLYANDDKAFREIYNRYWKKLYQTALAKTHTQEAAEELVQKIFISLWERRALAPIEHLESYLAKAVKYKVINYIHSFLVKEKHLARIISNTSTQENNSDTQVVIHELSLAIHTAIEKLPVKTKTIFKLSREENQSVKEIAKAMNLSEKAVEYHITQSLKMMRLHLKDFIVMNILLGLCFLL